MAFVTFITTCKNRLSHIQETLPLLFSEASNEEIIFVDYGCTQGSGNWVSEHYPTVKVLRVNDDPEFCLPRARNMGGFLANTPWLFFIDGDIKVRSGFVEWIKKNAIKNSYYRASLLENNIRDKETWGSCLCTRNDFISIDGYDEAFRGWGGEDDDFYVRLSQLGIDQKAYPNSFIDVISHDDELRLDAYDIKQKNHHLLINETYSAIKLALMRNLHSNKFSNKLEKNLDFSTRNQLMSDVISKIKFWIDNPDSSPPSFKINININHWTPEGFKLVQKCNFSFALSQTPIEIILESNF